MTRLTGRTCLITGASSGFGAHFARTLVREGARVVVGARRRERLDSLVVELGDAALAVAMDVTDEASIVAAFDAAEAHFGPIDTVIANAGVSFPGRSIDTPVDSLRATFDTNLLGLFLTAREGARRMIAAGSRKSGRGRIVLIGSMSAQMTLPGLAAYCASKAGVASLGRNFAAEWARSGINVNVIQPGYVLTEMDEEWFASPAGQAQMATFPRRRLVPIEALEEPAIHFCSDASAHTTGSVFMIDDGQSL